MIALLLAVAVVFLVGYGIWYEETEPKRQEERSAQAMEEFYQTEEGQALQELQERTEALQKQNEELTERIDEISEDLYWLEDN